MHTTRPRPSSRLLRPLLERRFRANPSYRLIAHDQLDASQREHFADLHDRRGHYGLLVPTDVVQSGVKAIDVELADLLTRLRRPGLLPAALADGADTTLHQRLASLVLDGILEVEFDGTLVSGPSAAPLLAPFASRPTPTDPIAAMSRDAMRIAYHLPTDDPVRVSSWLYHYNTMPLGPAAAQRLALTSARLLARPSPADDRGLCELYESTLHAAWHSWSRRDSGTDEDARRLL